MLEIDHIDADRGKAQILRGLSLAVAPGETLCVMGRNGAGKTTLLEAIMGQVPVTSGAIRLGPTRIDGLPAHRIPGHGIGYVPQGRRLFADLSVAENLEIGLRARGTPADPARRAQALSRFPRLTERLDQPAGTLSGGEQQMLAIARALCLAPGVLLLDEPSEGLQPSMRRMIADTIIGLRGRGTAILLVEQRVDTALAIADRIAFIVTGTCVETCPASTLTPRSPQFHAHLGI